MKDLLKEAIGDYQCSGCAVGNDSKECFKHENRVGEACTNHCPGTTIFGIGKIFLGMPKGFNRIGKIGGTDFKMDIFSSWKDSNCKYDKWNIPTWKHLNERGHTLVRGLRPRNNEPFIHIFLENCIDKIDCLEITQEDVNFMD